MSLNITSIKPVAPVNVITDRLVQHPAWNEIVSVGKVARNIIKGPVTYSAFLLTLLNLTALNTGENHLSNVTDALAQMKSRLINGTLDEIFPADLSVSLLREHAGSVNLCESDARLISALISGYESFPTHDENDYHTRRMQLFEHHSIVRRIQNASSGSYAPETVNAIVEEFSFLAITITNS